MSAASVSTVKALPRVATHGKTSDARSSRRERRSAIKPSRVRPRASSPSLRPSAPASSREKSGLPPPSWEDARGVDPPVHRAHQLGGGARVERREIEAGEAPFAQERPEERARGRVAVDLGRARGAREEDAGADHAPGHKMKKGDGRLVEPLQVVERDDDRRVGRDPAEEGADGVEDAVPIELSARGAELGQEGGEIGVEGVVAGAGRDGAEEIDPRAVGADHLGFERTAEERAAARLGERVGGLVEETRLADARLAREEQDLRDRSGPRFR